MPALIEVYDGEHASTINFLAKEGKIKHVMFEAGGVVYEANSIWAAHDWLKANGYMQNEKPPIRWLLG